MTSHPVRHAGSARAALSWSTLLRPAAAFGLLLAAAQGWAAADTAVSTNEITVTATKRGNERLQKVPLSVDVLTGASMQKKAALDFADIYQKVPGLSIQDNGPGDATYIVRGINAIGASTVGIYLDEAIVTGQNSEDGTGQQPDILLYDLDRVEVLKGPQGTTFGSSSMAGAIRYITAKPNLFRTTGYVSESFSSTQGANMGYRSEAAVSVPVIPGKLAVRVAGVYLNQPGWISNEFEKGANRELAKSGRAEIRLTPNENLTITGLAMTQNLHQDSENYYNKINYSGQPISQNGEQQADTARAPYDDRMNVYSGVVEYTQPYGVFTATASDMHRFNNYERDASYAAQLYFADPYNTTGRSVLEQPHTRDVQSYEARFNSTFSGPLQILLGVFNQSENRNFQSYWPTVNSNGYIQTNPTTVFLNRTDHTQLGETSVFGEVSYDITSQLKAIFGGRYYYSKIDDYSLSLLSGATTTGHYNDSGFIPRFNLAYQVTPDFNTYVQVAKGYRAGGVNDESGEDEAHVSIPNGYNSDTLWSYEVGAKSTFLNHRLTVNGAAYYIDWTGIQSTAEVSAPDGLTFDYIANGGAATIKGAELEVSANPISGLSLSFGGNYNAAALSQNNVAPTIGNKGDAIPYVPVWSMNASVDYSRPLPWYGLTGTVGADWTYTGARTTAFNANDSSFQRLPAYFVTAIDAGVSRDKVSFTLNVKNLFNSHAVTNYDNIVTGQYPNAYPDGYFTVTPRTVTGTLTVKF